MGRMEIAYINPDIPGVYQVLDVGSSVWVLVEVHYTPAGKRFTLKLNGRLYVDMGRSTFMIDGRDAQEWGGQPPRGMETGYVLPIHLQPQRPEGGMAGQRIHHAMREIEPATQDAISAS